MQVAFAPAFLVLDHADGRAVCDDATVTEDKDTVRSRERKVYVMGHQVDALEAGHRRVHALIGELPSRALTIRGVGGGDWSPKDLVGHLASWEEHALEALDAWDAGHGPAIDKALWSYSTNKVNREEVERKAKWSAPEVIRRAEASHEQLYSRLRAMSNSRWRLPGTSRGRKSVGERLGGILAGPAGKPFTHADAHMKDLEAFVAAHRS